MALWMSGPGLAGPGVQGQGPEGCTSESCIAWQVGAFGVDPNSTGPLDCHGHGCAATGTGCHSECECRHLDAIERQRWDTNTGFRYPKRPNLVITASRDGQRCASTWAFNAVRLLFRQAKESCDSYWMRHVTREKLQRRLVTGAHVVVKTHEWKGSLEAFEDLKKMLSHIVLSVREGFPREENWLKIATHVLHFEELVAYNKEDPEDVTQIGALTVLRKLAEHLGLRGLSPQDIRLVDYELMTLPMPKGSCNQTTKLWPFHSRRGGRPIPSAPPASP